jgi:hypothetical protein
MTIGLMWRGLMYVGVGGAAALSTLTGLETSDNPNTLPFTEARVEATPVAVEEGTPPVATTLPTTPSTVAPASPAVFTVNAPERSDQQLTQLDGWADVGTRVFTRDREIGVSETGAWAVEVTLAPGLNIVVIEAIGTDKQIRQRNVEIVYTGDAEPTGPVEFSATQLYRASIAEDPYEFLSGTATPLTTVALSSPHGVATAPVDRDGNWSSAIFFTAPGGPDPFPITVTADNGSAEFDFFYTSPT